MRLKRIKLENVRGVDFYDVRFNDAGVTIVEAPNESGKTTLLEAVDVLLWEKDSSGKKDVKDLQPVGRDVGSTIETELTFGETHLTCRKTYNRERQTSLHIHSPRPEQLAGAEAHDRLQEILEKELDKALYGALKIHQGRDLDALSLGDSDVLSTQLDAAAGGSGTTGGDVLLQRAKDVYETYFTEKTVKPKPDLKEADAKVSDLESEKNELDGRMKALQEDVKRLEGIERDLPDLERRVRDELKPALARQEKLVENVRSVEERRAARVAERDNAATRLKESQRARAERTEHAEALSKLQAGIEDLREARLPQQERLAKLEEDLAAKNKALEDAKESARKTRREREVQERILELVNARSVREKLRSTFERVRKIKDDAADAEQSLARIVLDDALLDEIKRADGELKLSQGILSADAPVVELRAHQDLELELDGSTMSVAEDAGIEKPIGERLKLHLSGVLELEVRAGASASDLQRRVSDAQAWLADACERAEVVDLTQAEKVAAEKRRHVSTLERRDEALDRELDGESPEELATRLQKAEACVATATERLPDDVELPELSTAQELLESSREAEESARRTADAVQEAREGAAETLRREREAASKSGATLETQVERAAALAEQLEEARREVPDDVLEKNVAEAAEAHRVTEDELEKVQAELEELRPEAVQRETESARTVLSNSEERIGRLREERAALQRGLEDAGSEGLGERRDEVDAALDRARSEQRRRWARAREARMLYTTLREARDEANRAYREPLRKGIVDQARKMLDTEDFDVELDEELRIVTRTMNGSTLRWDQLSAGTREQLAVLTALVAAEIAGDGGVPFVLDDALGYTDADRLARLGKLLGLPRKAQVIVLTCDENRFQYVDNASTVQLRSAVGERAEH